jgi:hypothetical protein
MKPKMSRYFVCFSCHPKPLEKPKPNPSLLGFFSLPETNVREKEEEKKEKPFSLFHMASHDVVNDHLSSVSSSNKSGHSVPHPKNVNQHSLFPSFHKKESDPPHSDTNANENTISSHFYKNINDSFLIYFHPRLLLDKYLTQYIEWKTSMIKQKLWYPYSLYLVGGIFFMGTTSYFYCYYFNT